MTISEMRIMDPTGDSKIMWDPANSDEVEAARKTFNDLRAKRFVAYSVAPSGSKGEVIREFDPRAEKLIMAPPMVGG